MNKFNLLIVVLVISIFISSCGNPSETESTPISATPAVLIGDTFPVDPLFSDFYEFLGGMDILGPAIAPMQDGGKIKTQYITSALLVYDPQSTDGEHYRLSPLGLYLGLAEPGVKNLSPSDVVVNEHIIDPKFLQAFKDLGGLRIVGRPITEARYYPDYGRYEQYFENLGFYIKTDDPDEEVHLLAYGSLACDHECRYQPQLSSIPSRRPPLQEPFASAIANLGALNVGRPLTDPYLSEDGKLEVIFENLVLVVETAEQKSLEKVVQPTVWLPLILAAGLGKIRGEQIDLNFRLWMPQIMLTIPGNRIYEEMQLSLQLWFPIVMLDSVEQGSIVKLRPIVEMIGIRRRPLVKNSDDPLMTFYSIENGRGHNVPIYFDGYIQELGGFQVTGNPISEVYITEGGLFRQCFENLCIDFDPGAPSEEQLKLASLGKIYKQRYYDELVESIQTQVDEDLQMRVWESTEFVSSKDSQEIHVVIIEDGIPIPALEPLLVLTLPDNSKVEYHFPPTDEDGWTSVPVPPIPAPMGTIIPYQVCLPGDGRDSICAGDHYLIWDIR